MKIVPNRNAIQTGFSPPVIREVTGTCDHLQGRSFHQWQVHIDHSVVAVETIQTPLPHALRGPTLTIAILPRPVVGPWERLCTHTGDEKRSMFGNDNMGAASRGRACHSQRRKSHGAMKGPSQLKWMCRNVLKDLPRRSRHRA